MVDNFRPGSVGSGLIPKPRRNQHRRFVIGCALFGVLLGFVLPNLTLEHQFWLIALPVGVFGLSHGGADPWILRQLGGARRHSQLLSTGIYLFLVGVFIGLIWLFPVLALLVFLAISVWHFGFTDAAHFTAERSYLLIVLSGSASVVGPVFGHPVQTGQLFAWLLNRDAAGVIAILEVLGPVLGIVWVVGFGVILAQMKAALDALVFLELALVAAAMVLLPPLMAFAFYFCLVHSIRHFMSLASNHGSEVAIGDQARKLLPLLLPATCGALALGFSAWGAIAFWDPASDYLVDAFRVMFWGLAALTLPHSFMVYRWWSEADNGQRPAD